MTNLIYLHGTPNTKCNCLTNDLRDASFISIYDQWIENALSKKEVDAAVMWEPNITKTEDNGVGKVLVDGTNLKRGDLLIIGREEYLTQNPEIAEIFLKVYKRGSDFIESNPDEAAQLIAKNFSLEPSKLKKVLPKYIYSTRITDEDINELKESAKFLKSQNLIKAEVDIDKFVDKKYLESAGIK